MYACTRVSEVSVLYTKCVCTCMSEASVLWIASTFLELEVSVCSRMKCASTGVSEVSVHDAKYATTRVRSGCILAPSLLYCSVIIECSFAKCACTGVSQINVYRTPSVFLLDSQN